MASATEFAKFLSQAAEITRRQETLLSDQTKGWGGFQYSQARLETIQGVSLGFGESTETPLVEIERPGDPPMSPGPEPDAPDQSEASTEEWLHYEEQLRMYKAAWTKFVDDKRKRHEQSELYRDLFRAQSEGDGKELVVGIVHLRSQKGVENKIDRPITLIDVLVELDETTGSLSILQAGAVRNELGWLPTELRSQFETANTQAAGLEQAYPEEFDDVIAALTNKLGTDFVAESPQGGKYLIDVEYVLAYRKQTATAISELMADMVTSFEKGDPPTDSYRALFEQELTSSGWDSGHFVSPLPLASSPVQQDIVEHALNNPLTVVLGPPGTGKTHTIANTAAALIGSGKRVLVTSERELPLLEVQNKLPKSMQALLLPIFGRGNVAALAKSSTGIVERQSSAGEAASRTAAIEELEQAVEKLKDSQVDLQRQLIEAGGSDSSTLSIDGVKLPLKGWMKQFRDDERTALFVKGGLLAGRGTISKDQAESLLEKTSALAEDHLVHAAYSFPPTLEELTSAVDLRSQAVPLQETLRHLGSLEEPSLAAIENWAQALKNVSEDLIRCGLPSVQTEPLPRRASLARSCTQASHILGNDSGAPDLKNEARIIKAGYEQVTKAFRLISADKTGYLERFVKDTAETKSAALRSLIEEAKQFQFRKRPIHNVVEVDSEHSPVKLLRQAENLRGHLEAGGRFKSLLGVPKQVKEASVLIESCHVDGDRISSKYLLGLAIQHLEAEVDDFNAHRWATASQFDGLQAEVQDWVESIGNLPNNAHDIRQLLHAVFVDAAVWKDESLQTVLSERAAELAGLLDDKVEPSEQLGAKPLEHAQKVLEEALECLPDVWQHHVSTNGLDVEALIVALEALTSVVAIGPNQPDEISSVSLQQIAKKSREDLQRNEARTNLDVVLAACRAPLHELREKSPGVEAALTALDNEDIDAYRDAWDRVRSEHVFWLAGTQYHKAFAEVSAQYPELTEAIRSTDAQEKQQAHDVLADVTQLQARRSGYQQLLEAFGKIPDFDDLNRRLQRVLTKRRNAEAQLAEAQCWHAALERLEANPSAIRGINSMKVAAQQVPKTKTAKSYPTKLAALRNAMKRALPGIPGVIMKMERCAELIGLPDSDEKKFDVVIVDEASQSLFTSLFVFGLADRVIVVGDNYQTSPRIPFGALIGLQMTQLALASIPNHPNVNQFSADFSLFDAALSMSKPFVMTEHFRCDPQIIELSNILCYEPNGHTLQPVKAPDPGNPYPVEVHYVEDGSLDDEGVNKAEADAVVSKILETISDQPNSTIGVVLVGSSPGAQVRHLNQEILDLVGPDEVARRELEIGTAAAFQGAERDVVLVSLIDAPTVDESVLRKKPQEFTGQNRYFVQDLNVAVSRAKSQLHIFHSFAPKELKDGDVRAVLLAAAKRTAPDVTDQTELNKCDSQFERDVFSAVRNRFPDAQIRTQVPAAGYKIDLVINQQGKEIAIECDGDQWHTSTDAVIRDTQRQRLLESLGWTFVRFLASQWYSPDAHEHWLARIEEALVSQ